MCRQNSLVDVALEVLLGVIKDASQAYPQLNFDKDILRLRSQTKTRGLGFISLDLPSLDKVLLTGLRDGVIAPSGPCSRTLKKAKVPKFLSGLWLRVFDKDGMLLEDVDEDSIFFLRQIFCFGKKLVSKCQESIIESAIHDFFEIDKNIRPVELWWFDVEGRLDHSHLSFSDGLVDLDDVLSDTERSNLTADVRTAQCVADILSSIIGRYDPYSFTGDQGSSDSIIEEREAGRVSFKHGPGAVSDLKDSDFKYHFPSWPIMLQHIFPFDAFGSHNFCVDKMPDEDICSPSKIIDVPKTMDKPRLIASEPTCNQWTQQITRNFLDIRFKETLLGSFIDLHDQSKSAKMVQTASVTGDLATIDLSEASDRLSAWAVLRLFRRNHSLLDALRAHRTMSTYHPKYHPSEHVINKFATQGTAVTFPVQSIMFLVCAITCSLNGEKPTIKSIKKLKGRVRVFGDDIIMPSRGYARMRNLLTYLGLKVNDNKSFSTGLFRESCGFDGYGGYDVTPLKPKVLTTSGPESYRSVLDTVNNLFIKGLWNASETLRRLTPGGFQNHKVVQCDSGSTGLRSFSGDDIRHLKRRWNIRLHREEVLVVEFNSTAKRVPVDSPSCFFQYIAERPRQDTNWCSGRAKRGELKRKLQWVSV